MDTPVVRLIIQAGLVPQNVLQQLERWKLLSPETAQSVEDGNQVGSSSREWGAEDFVQVLRRLIHEENMTIREAEFAVAGDFKKVWLFGRTSGQDVAGRVDAVVDKMGRVFLPIDALGGAEVEAISFSVTAFDAAMNKRSVARVETRYQDQKEAAHVIYLEEEGAEAARAPAPESQANGHDAAP